MNSIHPETSKNWHYLSRGNQELAASIRRGVHFLFKLDKKRKPPFHILLILPYFGFFFITCFKNEEKSTNQKTK